MAEDNARDDLDAPTPPGGPQRSDAPSGSHTPGEPAQDPGPEVQRVTRDEGGSAEEPVVDEATQGQAAHDLQEENAETHLDQPSQ